MLNVAPVDPAFHPTQPIIVFPAAVLFGRGQGLLSVLPSHAQFALVPASAIWTHVTVPPPPLPKPALPPIPAFPPMPCPEINPFARISHAIATLKRICLLLNWDN